MSFVGVCEKVVRNASREITDPAAYNSLLGVGIFNCIIALPTSIFNALVIAAITMGNPLTPSYLLLTNLAFSDLIVGIVCQPLLASVIFLFFSDQAFAFCYLIVCYYIVQSWSSWVSILTITAISIDRYFALRLKIKYKFVVTLVRVKCLLILIWLSALFAMAMFFVLRSNVVLYCIFGIVVHTICLFVILLCYILSYKSLKTYCVQVKPQNDQQSVNDGIDVIKYKRLLMTMLLVVIVIFLCYLPLLGVFITIMIPGSHESEEFKQFMLTWGLHILVGFISVMSLNSTCNPIVYITRMRDLRCACGQVIRKLLKKNVNTVNNSISNHSNG